MSKIILNDGSFVNEQIKEFFKNNHIEIKENYACITFDLGDSQDAQSFEENFNKRDFEFENFVTICGYDDDEDDDDEDDEDEGEAGCYCEVYFDISNISFEQIKEFVDFVQSIS